MKALIFEQWQGGHYFNYLECIVPALARICEEVVVGVTEQAASSDRFTKQLGALFDLPHVKLDSSVPLPHAKSRLEFRWQLGRNLIEAIRRNRPDYVFLPSADEQLLALPLASIGRRWLRGIPIEAVIHYPSFTDVASARARLVSRVQRGLLKTGVFRRLNFVNFLQYEEATSQGLSLARKARVAGDPVPQGDRLDRKVARRILGLEEGGRYLGMVGDLDLRKDVPATLAAFRQAGLRATDRLLLAGQLISPYRHLIQSEYADLVNQGRLILIDRYLSNQELAAAFSALTVHSSVYRQFRGLSSLMLKSLAAGTPVLVAEGGWGSAVVRRFEVGRVVDPTQIDSYSRVLQEAMADGDTFDETPAISRLLQFHSVANFVNGLLQPAAELAGRPLAGPVLTWSWVLDSLSPDRRHLV